MASTPYRSVGVKKTFETERNRSGLAKDDPLLDCAALGSGAVGGAIALIKSPPLGLHRPPGVMTSLDCREDGPHRVPVAADLGVRGGRQYSRQSSRAAAQDFLRSGHSVPSQPVRW